MNETELSEFEARLRQARPAMPPPEFERRLMAARPVEHARRAEPQCGGDRVSWLAVLRWLVPVTALLLAAGLLWLGQTRHSGRSRGSAAAANGAGLKADQIQIDHELVSAVDAIARLPEGEPVRFRYREWMDDVVLRDSAQGVVIHQRTPRVEIEPVRFETY